MKEKTRILYVGRVHDVTDDRLAHKQMRTLKTSLEDAEFYFVDFEFLARAPESKKDKDAVVDAVDVLVDDLRIRKINVRLYENIFTRLLGYLVEYRWSNVVSKVLKALDGAKIDFVQGSDVKELAFSKLLSKNLGCKLIYDSHEDYIRQSIDYGNKSIKAYLVGFIYFLAELRFVRSCDHLFCTDEYLERKYKSRIYGQKKVSLLRNFPYIENLPLRVRSYEEKDTLSLVYIGGVNEWRGVVEVAEYVYQFNKINDVKKLSFTIFSNENPIIDDLVARFGVIYHGWVEYQEAINQLYMFDVGVCLLLPIKKFYRNLPIKNFDYMATGLPYITSDFGGLANYVRESGSGVCINPRSYAEFEAAINKMFMVDFRMSLGSSGRNAVYNGWNFTAEADEYIDCFR